jgi:uncharacterized protein (DUF1800 family)
MNAVVVNIESNDSEASNAPAPDAQSRLAHAPPSANTPYAAWLGALLASGLAACGGGGDSTGGGTPRNFPKAQSDEEAARFLQQAQFSSTPAEIAQMRTTSYVEWLEQQFAAPSTTGWDWLESRGYGNEAKADKFVYQSSIADFMVWNQIFTAPDAMRVRMALALSEFFVVSLQSMEIDWRGYAVTAYWDLLKQHAFGNFRDLLEEVTLSAAMGNYLNTRGNQKEDLAKGRQPDENYAREVMQLFSVGLHELNLDGTEKRDGQGKKIETYDSDDVSQLARVFTGYDYDEAYRTQQPPGFSGRVYRREYARQRLKFDAAKHSTLAVNFLNVSIAANTEGPQALKLALDGLFAHPNVGPFFAKQMIQRLVTSNPSPGYVARVASAFNNNGQNRRGDLKAVWAAILLDDEARGLQSLSDIGFGKVREPMLRFAQWGRSFGLRSLAGSWKLFDQSDASNELGQSPLRSPSVFNFFRPGYIPPGTAIAERAATAPEFQIVNETTVSGYINFMKDKIRNGINVPAPTDPEPLYISYSRDILADYRTELALITNTADPTDADAMRTAQAMTQRLNLLLCAGQMSASTTGEIQNALKAAILQKKIKTSSTEVVRLDWVAAGVLMTMASPDYLVQK